MENLNIRQEQFFDYKTVENVVELAFKDMPMADGNEHELVAKLRSSQAFIPFLSLVAEIDGKIVGHIMFTKATVGDDVILTLAPVSVLPEYQNQGIGGQLILVGHELAKNFGYKCIVVLGHEKYYPKFGYTPASNFGITCPFDVPSKNFMAIELVKNGLKDISGEAKHAKEFFE